MEEIRIATRIRAFKKVFIITLLLSFSIMLSSCKKNDYIISLTPTYQHYYENTQEFVDTHYHENYTYDYSINKKSLIKKDKFTVNCWIEYYKAGNHEKNIYLIKDKILSSNEGKITINLYDFGGDLEKWSAYAQYRSRLQTFVYHKEYKRINPNADITSGIKVILPLGESDVKEYNLNSPIILTTLINATDRVVHDDNIFLNKDTAMEELLLNENLYLIKIEFSDVTK